MAKNFPDFFPLIYHDIKLEIPPPFQGACRRFYYGWQFLIIGSCFFDIVASIIYFAAAAQATNLPVSGPAINYIGLRVVHLLLLPLGYFWLIYWPLYKALKKNNSIAWAVFWVANTAYGLWLVVMMSGIWPGELNWGLISGHWISSIFGIVSLVDKGIWTICISWWIFQTLRVYMIYRYEADPVHSKIASQPPTELNDIKNTPQAPPTKRPLWGPPTATTKVAGQDVKVSVDPRVAANVAKTAVTSGAAGQLAAGTKVKMGADGQVSYQVDPKAAQKAASTMHASGATSELAAGTTVSSGGWSWGGSKTASPAAPAGGPTKMLKVIHDFVGQEQGDLSIKAGDKVAFIRKVDENWVEGSLNGKTGIFPSKFAADA